MSECGGGEPSDPGAEGGTAPSRMPIVIVAIGMAGTGKTTFLCRLYNFILSKLSASLPEGSAPGSAAKKIYTLNLDPAVKYVPFPCNIDIRDSVKYKQVMAQYRLGPNGAIMTSLNLFATRFHAVLALMQKRAPNLEYILIDTPGQIEVFNWSASGSIILDALSAAFPVAVCYLIDTPRCERAVTFMSNMLYACSVLYKTKLPFVTAFNKIDVQNHEFCLEWMRDYNAFAESVLQDTTYMASLSRSCALALAEFYCNLKTVGISSATGTGFNDLLAAFQECRQEYDTEYLPWLEFHRKQHKEAVAEVSAKSQTKFEEDAAEDETDTRRRHMSRITLVPKLPDKEEFDKPETSAGFRSEIISKIPSIPEEAPNEGPKKVDK